MTTMSTLRRLWGVVYCSERVLGWRLFTSWIVSGKFDPAIGVDRVESDQAASISFFFSSFFPAGDARASE